MKSEINLSPLTYKEWLNAVFDRSQRPASVARRRSSPPGSARTRRIGISDPGRFVRHLAQFCQEYHSVSAILSTEDLGRGMLFLLSDQVDLATHLLDKGVPLTDRLACIRAMYWMSAGCLMAGDHGKGSEWIDLWWNNLGETFWRSIKADASGDSVHSAADLDCEASLILSVIAETLDRIGDLETLRAQRIARHGLATLRPARDNIGGLPVAQIPDLAWSPSDPIGLVWPRHGWVTPSTLRN